MSKEIDMILHSEGYLPPRTEQEMKVFEKLYSKVKPKKPFRVDVNKIVEEENKK